jgi:hypothetical protein
MKDAKLLHKNYDLKAAILEERAIAQQSIN